MRYKVAIRFAIDGDLRFISHHDSMRLFERALSRAQLPVKYSEGFNPRPKLSLPLPRAVGVASEADVLVVDFDCQIAPDAVLTKLAEQMPGGITLMEAWPLDGGRTLQVDRVEYAVAVPDEQVAAIAVAIEQMLAQENCFVERVSADGKREKTIDLRAYLTEISVSDGMLKWTVHVTNSGTVRPTEILAAMGLAPQEYHHRVRRTRVHWNQEVSGELVASAGG